MSAGGLSAEWAEVGKRSGDRGYRVLRCSAGPLSEDNFFEIHNRLSTGTPDRLPQVKIGFAGQAGAARVVLAVESPGEADRDGRPVTVTRIFCVPYAALAASPVSYRALYEALHGVVPDDGAQVTITPRPLAETGPMETDEVARTTAALLLTKQPVSVIGADAESLEDKIDFIDLVAGHLPYGMRAKFNAASWASSTSQHKVRLTFTQHPRKDGHVVEWRQRPDVPQFSRANDYLRALEKYDDKGLLAELASQTEALTFAQEDVFALILRLAASAREKAAPSAAPKTQGAVVEPWDTLLQHYVDVLKANRNDLALDAVQRVRAQAAHLPEGEEREACRRIVETSGLLGRITDAQAASAVVAAAYTRPLDGTTMARILEVTREPTPAVVSALESQSGPEARLFLAGSDRARKHVFDEYDDLNLVRIATAATVMQTVRFVADELARRHKSRKGNEELADLLAQISFLAPQLHHLGQHSLREQREILRTLLRAAYGSSIKNEATFAAALGPRPTELLLVAAMSMYTGGRPRSLALDHFYAKRMLDLSEGDKRVADNLRPTEPAGQGPPASFGRQKPWDRHRHNTNGEPQGFSRFWHKDA